MVTFHYGLPWPAVVERERGDAIAARAYADQHAQDTSISAATGPVVALAVGVLADGTPVIVSSNHDGTVRMLRLDGGTLFGTPLHLAGDVNALALAPDTTVITALGWHLAAHRFLAPAD